MSKITGEIYKLKIKNLIEMVKLARNFSEWLRAPL